MRRTVTFMVILLTMTTLSHGQVPSELPRPQLISPTDGAMLDNREVELTWQPVYGATSYGIEIVCTKGEHPALYAFNSGPDSTYSFRTPKLGGDFVWSVIAFDRGRALGRFSKGRSFHVKPVPGFRDDRKTELTNVVHGQTKVVIVRASDSVGTTDIYVHAGQIVSIQADGRWSHGMQGSSRPMYGPDGYSKPASSGFPNPESRVGVLVCKIGDGTWVEVGSAATFTSKWTGVVSLIMNDLRGSYGDNQGKVSVNVTVGQ